MESTFHILLMDGCKNSSYLSPSKVFSEVALKGHLTTVTTDRKHSIVNVTMTQPMCRNNNILSQRH